MKRKLQSALIALAQNYNQAVTRERVDSITHFVEASVGLNHDWDSIAVKIASNEEFFPTTAVILKYITTKKTLALDSPHEKAKACVDRFIAYLTGSLTYSEVPKEDMVYCKRKFNVDKFAYQAGGVNLDFRRKEWIEMVELDFEYGVKDNEPLAPGAVKDLVGSIVKTLPESKP